ncbi:MAG: oxygen-independent coproporphyrinogen III oxidase [Rhodospirillaceae bacterium]|jgi:oxygen-independent coproporphyrinogen-3 oxidase|nr:oxygen-independent coproporphyrinogen III oxidase [Rhodospirillaceae bacterium]|tara:strand:- start:2696 stop:4069 length:1374 start_codon:yes stop_codon:yes gene_type:complete
MKLVNISGELIKKYNVKGSYYTSYPTVQRWSNEFDSASFVDAVEKSYEPEEKFPLCLYTHFPYCASLCYYCICHMQVSHNDNEKDEFLRYFLREIDMLRLLCDKKGLVPDVKEIHLGGGSPTYMNREQFDKLISKFETIVNMKDLEECALEIDIRTITQDDLFYYAEKGINRISFGVQDFQEDVQKAVNRVQPVELFKEIITPDIVKLFKGINFDLIYGLPLQTRDSFKETIEQVKEFSPARVSVYTNNYNPDQYKHHTAFKASDMPDEEEKTRMYLDAVESLLESGYEKIGIDHFAKKDDPLAIAKRNKTLHRSFMGYTVGRSYDLVGIGPSALSEFGSFYSQNVYENSNYFQAIEEGKFPTLRGYELNLDETIRREIMKRLLCHFSLDIRGFEKEHKIDFNGYFKSAIGELGVLAEDGLLEISNDAITVTPEGEFFVRHACRAFDKFESEEVLKI